MMYARVFHAQGSEIARSGIKTHARYPAIRLREAVQFDFKLTAGSLVTLHDTNLFSWQFSQLQQSFGIATGQVV